MATSRKESQPNARTNRGVVRNMSPVLKPSGSDQGLRRARSVPSSPDRRSSASTAASSSSDACRPSSSFNPRSTAPSRSSTSSGSASSSSSTHGRAAPLHSVSAMVGAKQAAGVMRRRATDKSTGATSVWPHALTTPGTTSPSKDPASKAAKSPSSNAQKSKLSTTTRPGAEKTAVAASAAPSPKPRTQKATGAAGKTQAASSSARNPGAMAKRRTGMEISIPSIQRTTSMPVAAAAVAPRAQEQDVELLMGEFDEMESISTPSIEEHLQQRLPDPVDVAAFATSGHAPSPSEASSNREEHKDDQEAIAEPVVAEEEHEHLDGGDSADVAKEAAAEAELKQAAEEAELNESAIETLVVKESVGETEMNETVCEIDFKLNGADGETEIKEADSEAELKDPESAVKEEAKANEERTILPATKTAEAVQRWRASEVTQEGRSKTTMQERRSKVMALVGRFETAMSGRE